jgi:hypothetical protein
MCGVMYPVKVCRKAKSSSAASMYNALTNDRTTGKRAGYLERHQPQTLSMLGLRCIYE